MRYQLGFYRRAPGTLTTIAGRRGSGVQLCVVSCEFLTTRNASLITGNSNLADRWADRYGAASDIQPVNNPESKPG